MDFLRWMRGESIENRNVYYKLNVIFVLLLLFPVLGFFYFGYRYGFLQDEYLKPFLLVGLVYTFVGFTLLRRLFDKIVSISDIISEKVGKDLQIDQQAGGGNELQRIIHSFNAIEQRFRESTAQLNRKASEISILKELSDLCYVTLDPGEILHVTLERALLLSKSDVGSILILEKKAGRSFVVKASIGLGDYIKIDDKIDFETSIAKYAVINKSPLIVKDIEQERRFGRANRIHYGTKSFICMPIKTIKDIVGVLTVSCRDDDRVYTQDDVDVLTPLLSNAAFTYENIRLLKELEQDTVYINSIEKIFRALNSSLRDSELLHAILDKLKEIVPFELAIVMQAGESKTDSLTISHIQASETMDISVGDHFNGAGSIIERVLNQEAIRVVENTGELRLDVEKKLLGNMGYRSCLLAPLTMGGKVRGVIVLYGHNPGIFFDNLKPVELMANTLSLAVQENRLAATVIKRRQELDTIKQIGSALATSTFDIKKVLNYTMDMIRVLMNVEAGSLSLVKDGGLEFAVSFEIDVESLKKFRLELGRGIVGSVASRGEAIVVNDITKSTHFYAEIDAATGFETRSVLCVPMISQGKVIGAIEVLNKRRGDFTANDLDLLQSIATSVSIALENARLYEETVAMAEQERGIRSMFQKFVPKEILDQIIHGSKTGENVVEEFKTITLLNIDMRGFSKLIKEIGPQKSVALLNHFFSVMGGIVFKHRGIVDKYLGDGFLALFGAPVSSTMDAENAVHAALEMQQSIKAVNDFFEKELGASVNIGISIHTGEVVVGNVGFEMKMDYTVLGEPVNAVFRMQDLTKPFPNGILIGESACRAAKTRLKLREIEQTVADSKVYELLGYLND